jgi:hypothetical protein
MNVIEWCKKNDVWYLNLGIDIPEIIQKEVQDVYKEGFFVPHRTSDGEGWMSSSLYGWTHKTERNTDEAWRFTTNPSFYGYDEKDVNWGWSCIQEIAPETKRWLEDLPRSHYRRCRFMLLSPNGYIKRHQDATKPRIAQGRRFEIISAINFAITQPENCYVRRSSDKVEIPFKPCKGFWFDNGVYHEAKNSSNENRFHFIIHSIPNEEQMRLVKKSLVEQYGSDVNKEIDSLF